MIQRLSTKYIWKMMGLFLLMLGCKAENFSSSGESKKIMEKNAQQIIKYGSLPAYEGSSEYFTGKVSICSVFDKNTITESATGAFVTFEPQARTHWHMHPKGQILIISDGVGYTQFEGGNIQEVGIGDTIICPPKVKHWHGASPDSYMTHFAVTGELNGENVQWMEPVSDEQYFQN